MSEKSIATGRILSCFASPIEPVKKTVSYNLGVIMTIISLIMLPMVYIGIMAIIGGLSVLHLKYNSGIMQWHIGSSWGLLIKLFCYLGPAIGAVTMIVFMLKPLFKKRPKPSDTILLSYNDAPDFFEFVHKICASVRAPKPTEIRLFNEVNAYASFLPGIRGIGMGKLCLTMGLPLLSSMNTRALAGVIAHEFGHFAQGAGMRTTFLIRTLIHFFHRVVYERDILDERIEAATDRLDYRVGIFVLLARFFIWISRFILEKVGYLGLLVGTYTMRKMEFDADRYEARLAGSDQFEKTSTLLHTLGYSWAHADRLAENIYNEDKTLPDNYGALINYGQQKLSSEMLQQITREQLDKKTGRLDTHPCDSERIASARAEKAPGIFIVEEDSRLLFSDFDSVARACTQHYFSHVTGDDVSKVPLYDCDEYVKYLSEADKDAEACNRVWESAVGILAPLPMDLDIMPEPGADYRTLKQAISDGREKIIMASKSFDEALSHLNTIAAGSAALNAGYTITPGDFGFDDLPEDGGKIALQCANMKLDSARKELDNATMPLQRWINYSLFQVSRDEMLGAEVQPIKSLSLFFLAQYENIFTIYESFRQLNFILTQEVISSYKRKSEITRLIDAIQPGLGKIREASVELIVPFSRKPENRRLEQYLFGRKIADPGNHMELCNDVGAFFQTISQLYLFTHGRLLRMIEAWESKTNRGNAN
jgi:Zn-dependent protease with chaperone function